MSASNPLLQKYGKTYPQGTVLFREGDAGGEMFVVHSGRIRITKRIRDRDVVLANLGPGEPIGEMAILANSRRSATAEVEEEACLLVIDSRTLETMLRTDPEIAIRMLRKMAGRLAETNGQLERQMLGDASSRVVHLLAHEAELRGRIGPDGAVVPMSPAEVAARLGVDPEVVARVVGRMERARICRRIPAGFLVPEPGKLREFLDFLGMSERVGQAG